MQGRRNRPGLLKTVRPAPRPVANISRHRNACLRAGWPAACADIRAASHARLRASRDAIDATPVTLLLPDIVRYGPRTKHACLDPVITARQSAIGVRSPIAHHRLARSFNAWLAKSAGRICVRGAQPLPVGFMLAVPPAPAAAVEIVICTGHGPQSLTLDAIPGRSGSRQKRRLPCRLCFLRYRLDSSSLTTAPSPRRQA